MKKFARRTRKKFRPHESLPAPVARDDQGPRLNQSAWDYPVLPWLSLLFFTSAFRGKIVHGLLGHRLLTTIGGMCYTIYMYHWLMISGLIRFTIQFSTHIFWLDLLVQFILISAVIVAVCSVLFVLFERPFMQRDWPQKIWAWVNRKMRVAF